MSLPSQAAPHTIPLPPSLISYFLHIQPLRLIQRLPHCIVQLPLKFDPPKREIEYEADIVRAVSVRQHSALCIQQTASSCEGDERLETLSSGNMEIELGARKRGVAERATLPREDADAVAAEDVEVDLVAQLWGKAEER
jgi:hypothetical protein